MRVLVLGGTGFVGSAVCAALSAAGDEVECADITPPRPTTARLLEDIPFRIVRIEDYHDVAQAMSESRAETAIALSYVAGAASEADPYRASSVNIQGPMNCLEAAALTGTRRVVFASSIGVYGPDQDYYGERDLTEEDSCPFDRHTLSYSATKASNEFLTAKLAAHHGTQVCHVRLSIVFGHGREHGFTTWASDIGSAPALGEPVTLPFRPDQRSSLIYVDDAARLLTTAAHVKRLTHTVYNSGGHTVSTTELADAVTAIEPSAEISIDPAAEPQPFVSRISGARARDELGFRPTPLDTSLRQHMDAARAASGLMPNYYHAEREIP